MGTTVAGFSAENTRKLVGASYRQLVHWDTTGLLRPSVERAKGRGSRRVYSFEDLVELRVICRLLAAGVTLRTVRVAARYIRDNFKSVTRPLARLALVVDGKKVLIRTMRGGELVDATARGQIVINFAVGPIAEAVRGEVETLGAPREIKVRVAGGSYTAVLTPDLIAGGFTIAVRELPGVFTEADTVPEARAMVRDLIPLYLAEREAQPTRKARSRHGAAVDGGRDPSRARDEAARMDRRSSVRKPPHSEKVRPSSGAGSAPQGANAQGGHRTKRPEARGPHRRRVLRRLLNA